MEHDRGPEGADVDPLEAAFRAGYAAGADAMQLEARGRPWLSEDEAVDAWRTGNGV